MDLRFYGDNGWQLYLHGGQYTLQLRTGAGGAGVYRLHLSLRALHCGLPGAAADFPCLGGDLFGPGEPEKGDLYAGFSLRRDLFSVISAGAGRMVQLSGAAGGKPAHRNGGECLCGGVRELLPQSHYRGKFGEGVFCIQRNVRTGLHDRAAGGGALCLVW